MKDLGIFGKLQKTIEEQQTQLKNWENLCREQKELLRAYKVLLNQLVHGEEYCSDCEE